MMVFLILRKCLAYFKKEKIPFVIFVNTESVGSNGYMTWDELREISQFDFVHIGNHSHSHAYLADKMTLKLKKT